mmetsp:Transcript_50609/g.99975  ORF Transcript_50609/g.99975 Transcript_50609/m.99975 type:complete len:214 (+) Transcript_50609:536-1177(+)
MESMIWSMSWRVGPPTKRWMPTMSSDIGLARIVGSSIWRLASKAAMSPMHMLTLRAPSIRATPSSCGMCGRPAAAAMWQTRTSLRRGNSWITWIGPRSLGRREVETHDAFVPNLDSSASSSALGPGRRTQPRPCAQIACRGAVFVCVCRSPEWSVCLDDRCRFAGLGDGQSVRPQEVFASFQRRSRRRKKPPHVRCNLLKFLDGLGEAHRLRG